MNRTDLLNAVQEAIRTEESATSIFLEHLYALTERVGIDEHLAQQTQTVLAHLIEESKRHKSILESLQARIKGDERNDW